MSDVQVRTFWLVDDRGEVFDLMGKGTDFFNAPQNLGQSHTIDYANLHTQRRVLKKRPNFQTIKGEMFFSSYAESRAFRSFVNKSNQRVRLYQRLPDVDYEYYANVEVTLVDRSEKEATSGILKCEVSFECVSFWTREVSVVLFDNVEFSTGTTDSYTYTYPQIYASSYASSQYTEIVLNNLGDLPAPITIIINGLSVSPEWKIGNQSGGLNYTVQQGVSVVIDSRDDVHTITSGDTVIDTFKRHELQNYLTVPIGTHVLTFKNVKSAEVKLYEYFLSI